MSSLPSHHHLFLLNLDKSPVWLFLSNLLSNRMLCPYKEKLPKWRILIGSKRVGKTALTDIWCLHHLKLVSELQALPRLWTSDWTSGMKPSGLQSLFSSHPLHLYHFSSSSCLVALFFCTLSLSVWFRKKAGLNPKFFSSPVSFTKSVYPSAIFYVHSNENL